MKTRVSRLNEHDEHNTIPANTKERKSESETKTPILSHPVPKYSRSDVT
jgi:hypothetical protein